MLGDSLPTRWNFIPCLCRLIFNSRFNGTAVQIFWSYFSAYLFSFLLVHLTNSSHLSPPKLSFLSSHFGKTGVLYLKVPSWVMIQYMPLGRELGKSWCPSCSFSSVMDNSPGLPISNVWTQLFPIFYVVFYLFVVRGHIQGQLFSQGETEFRIAF